MTRKMQRPKDGDGDDDSNVDSFSCTKNMTEKQIGGDCW